MLSRRSASAVGRSSELPLWLLLLIAAHCMQGQGVWRYSCVKMTKCLGASCKELMWQCNLVSKVRFCSERRQGRCRWKRQQAGGWAAPCLPIYNVSKSNHLYQCRKGAGAATPT